MSYIRVKLESLNALRERFGTTNNILRSAVSDVNSVISGLDWDVSAEEKINTRLHNVTEKLDDSITSMSKTINFLSDAFELYRKAEEDNCKLSETYMENMRASGMAIIEGVEKQKIEREKERAVIGEKKDDGLFSADFNTLSFNADSDVDLFNRNDKIDYNDKEWDGGIERKYFDAGAGIGAGYTFFNGGMDGEMGDDNLGIEGSANFSVGTVKVGGKGEISYGEDGLNANLQGEAMVAAIEGEAKGTINFLGLEITGTVGGYAGAYGVEGTVGIVDNKFKIEGGAAALIGGSVGLEIGFNDEGWENFIDVYKFWDYDK